MIKYLKRIDETLKRGQCIQAWAAWQNLLRQEKYQIPTNLMRFGAKSYSQNDEDGIITEIFRRIGITNKTFIEVGVGDGLENNTLALLIQGWSGLWVEGSPKLAKKIRYKFETPLASGQLQLQEAFVTMQNFNALIGSTGGGEVDLFSLDLDGNDFHLLSSMTNLNPRVIVAEYNAKFLPNVYWVMDYNEAHSWDETDYFGASLVAFTGLLERKGYGLVACNACGTNAFFVRNDLLENKFQPGGTQVHYEPARYWMAKGMVSGHPANFGAFNNSI